MIKHNFSITDIFVSAWESTKKNAWFLFIVTIAAGAIMGATSRIPVISQLIGFVISISVTTVSLMIVHDKTPDYEDLLKSFKNYKIVWHYFLASILYIITIFIPILIGVMGGVDIILGYLPKLLSFIPIVSILIFTIPSIYLAVHLIFVFIFAFPGIYLAVRLQFYKFLVIEDENLGPVDALKKSMKMTDGHFWKLLGFMFSLIILNILGVLLFKVGLLITIPVSMIASTYLYKKLLPTTNNDTVHHEEVKAETEEATEPTQEETVKSEEVQQ